MEKGKKKEYEPAIVKQRTTKHPITVESPMGLKTLKIRASLQDWKKLEDYCLANYNSFTKDFLNTCVYPAINKAKGKKSCWAKSQYERALGEQTKTDAGWLHPFLSHWCKKPLDTWPEYLKRIELASSDDDRLRLQNKRGEKDPVAFTAYCLERIYGRKLKMFGLNPFFPSGENFYIKYIHNNKRAKTVKKLYIDNKTDQEIEALAYDDPILRRIFKSLRVI